MLTNEDLQRAVGQELAVRGMHLAATMNQKYENYPKLAKEMIDIAKQYAKQPLTEPEMFAFFYVLARKIFLNCLLDPQFSEKMNELTYLLHISNQAETLDMLTDVDMGIKAHKELFEKFKSGKQRLDLTNVPPDVLKKIECPTCKKHLNECLCDTTDGTKEKIDEQPKEGQ